MVGLDCDLEPLCSLLVHQMRPVGAEDLSDSLFVFFVLKKVYDFSVLGLRCCSWPSLVAASGAALELLWSLAAEPRLQGGRAQSPRHMGSGAQAQ